MNMSKLACIKLAIVFLLPITCISFVHGQDTKQEYEKSIRASEVPEEILELLSPLLEESRRIRYYKELDGENTGYEIEMQWKGRQLSVEFYDDDRGMDIEELIGFEEIAEEAHRPISTYLQNHFDKYKITRLQRQYIAEERDEEDEEVIEDFMEGDTEDLTKRYEMVIEVKGKDMFGAYEFLFDHEGQLINTQKIERRSSDNVLY